MSLLVISGPGDVHASALAWAGEAYGMESILWSPAPPWTPPGFVRFDSEGNFDYRFPGRGGEVNARSVDAVWLRRWPIAHFPDRFDDGDRLAARNELAAYHKGVLALLPDDVLWANPIAARDRSNFKLRQLAVARSAGLRIPETLVTDDAGEARRFVAASPKGAIVYKPFYTFHWHGSGRRSHTVTTPVTEADFDSPEQLVWCPGIFQRFVEKAFELRVSVFGRACVTVRITGQDPIDWRTRQGDMKVEPFRLPEPVERNVHALMDRLGLAMGMIDLIVTPDGDYVFLEVNEQGQFLWVEEMCEEALLLDTCARFFASGDRSFRDSAIESAGISFAGFLASAAYERVEKEDREFREAGGVHNPLLIRE
jgi:glutathione synthase/RimK-type ligase-like ATP-grasp enzyme